MLEQADKATLKATIDYAESRLTEDSVEEDDDSEETPNQPPKEFEGDDEAWAEAIEGSQAPSRATLTTKLINDNEYLYWQWSEDGKTKSEYISPKNPN